jgi:hypothetical protein
VCTHFVLSYLPLISKNFFSLTPPISTKHFILQFFGEGETMEFIKISIYLDVFIRGKKIILDPSVVVILPNSSILFSLQNCIQLANTYCFMIQAFLANLIGHCSKSYNYELHHLISFNILIDLTKPNLSNT